MTSMMIHDILKITVEKESYKLDSGSFTTHIRIRTKCGNMDIALFSHDKDNLKLIPSK